jgi:cbb3-type cytochrome oxidase subunit 3
MMPVLIIHAVADGLPLLLVCIIAVAYGKPPKPKRKFRPEEEDYLPEEDDRDYDEGEPRPRRQPPDDRIRPG